MLGAALAANTLDDLDIVHQMASVMGSDPLFGASEWVDVRLSEGENGSLLFVHNYQDDPITTTLSMRDVPLLGGEPLTLPARRGVILAIDWRVRPGVVIHLLTAEVIAVIDDGAGLTLHTEPAVFVAEVTLTGYRCDAELRCEPI